MLTASQCAVVAFIGDGEIICRDCAIERLDNGDLGVVNPVIQYEADTDQAERWAGESLEDIWGEDEAPNHTDECLPAYLCDACGGEIVEAYHYGHAEDDDDDA